MTASESAEPSERWHRAGFAGVLALAALARLAVARGSGQVDLVSDMIEYWTRAAYVFEHGALHPDSWRMPGLPMWLAASFSVAGAATLDAARASNVVAGCLTTAATYLLARRVGNRRDALVSAGIVAVYPTLLLYTTLVATETLVALPILGALIAATLPTRLGAVAMGISAAVAVLVRPASIAVIPAGIAAAVGAPPPAISAHSRASRVACFLASCVLVLSPWWLHNYRLYGRFIPLDTTGGLNLAIGSGPGATGRWYFSHVLRLQSGELAGVDVTTPAGSDRAMAAAIAHVQGSPLRWLRLVPAKLAALFSVEGRETAYLYSIGYFGDRSPLVVATWAIAVMAAFPLLLTAAAGGLARDAFPVSARVPLLLTIAATAAMHLLTFGDPRFHLPLVPLLAVAAPYASLRQRPAMWASLVTCALLAPAWYAQAAQYMPFLRLLMLPGGSNSPLSFDALF